MPLCSRSEVISARYVSKNEVSVTANRNSTVGTSYQFLNRFSMGSQSRELRDAPILMKNRKTGILALRQWFSLPKPDWIRMVRTIGEYRYHSSNNNRQPCQNTFTEAESRALQSKLFCPKARKSCADLLHNFNSSGLDKISRRGAIPSLQVGPTIERCRHNKVLPHSSCRALEQFSCHIRGFASCDLQPTLKRFWKHCKQHTESSCNGCSTQPNNNVILKLPKCFVI